MSPLVKKLFILIPIIAILIGVYFFTNKFNPSVNDNELIRSEGVDKTSTTNFERLTEQIMCPVNNTEILDYEEEGTVIEVRRYNHLCPSKQQITVLKQSSTGVTFLKLRNQVAESILFLKQRVEPEEKRQLVENYKDKVYLLEGGNYQWISGNMVLMIKSGTDSLSMNVDSAQVNEITDLVDHYLTLYPPTDDLVVAQPDQTSFMIKERDGKRLPDIQRIRFALALYFQDKQTYPIGDSLSLGQDASSCLGDIGWTSMNNCRKSYLDKVPSDPLPSKAYIYTQLDKGNSYKIVFTLEGEIGGYQPGLHILTSEGIK